MINITDEQSKYQYNEHNYWRAVNKLMNVEANKHDIDAEAHERLALRIRSAEAILDICLVAAICLAMLLVSWVITQGS